MVSLLLLGDACGASAPCATARTRIVKNGAPNTWRRGIGPTVQRTSARVCASDHESDLGSSANAWGRALRRRSSSRRVRGRLATAAIAPRAFLEVEDVVEHATGQWTSTCTGHVAADAHWRGSGWRTVARTRV